MSLLSEHWLYIDVLSFMHVYVGPLFLHPLNTLHSISGDRRPQLCYYPTKEIHSSP